MEAELSKREKEVVKAIAYGASVEECAEELFIAKRTVINHLQHIYDKTGARSLNSIAAWYFCKEYNISFRLSPNKKKLIVTCFIALLVPNALMDARFISYKLANTRFRETYNTTAI